MTKYYCVVCKTIYDDEKGMPIKGCSKIPRHILKEKNKKC